MRRAILLAALPVFFFGVSARTTAQNVVPPSSEKGPVALHPLSLAVGQKGSFLGYDGKAIMRPYKPLKYKLRYWAAIEKVLSDDEILVKAGSLNPNSRGGQGDGPASAWFILQTDIEKDRKEGQRVDLGGEWEVIGMKKLEKGNYLVVKKLPELPERKLSLKASLEGQHSKVQFLDFNSDGTLLASVSSGTFKLWDAKTGQEKGTYADSTNGIIKSLAFSSDGKILASARMGLAGLQEQVKISLWDVKRTVDETRFMEEDAFSVKLSKPNHFIAITRDCKLLASMSNVPMQGTIKLCDVRTGEEKITLNTGGFTTLAFSRDGTMLALASRDQTLKVYDVETGKLKTTLKEGNGSVAFLTFSPDGNFLAVGINGTIKLFDLKTGQQMIPQPGQARSVAFSPDGTILASWSGLNTKLWNLKTRRQIGKSLRRADELGWPVAFSPDATLLATGSRDGTIKLWDFPAINKASK